MAHVAQHCVHHWDKRTQGDQEMGRTEQVRVSNRFLNMTQWHRSFR